MPIQDSNCIFLPSFRAQDRGLSEKLPIKDILRSRRKICGALVGCGIIARRLYLFPQQQISSIYSLINLADTVVISRNWSNQSLLPQKNTLQKNLVSFFPIGSPRDLLPPSFWQLFRVHRLPEDKVPLQEARVRTLLQLQHQQDGHRHR